MDITTIENVIMNVFRNGFLARKLMMVAIMIAVAVNTINTTTMARSSPNSPSCIFGIFLKVSKNNNVKMIENVMISVLRNRFLK